MGFASLNMWSFITFTDAHYRELVMQIVDIVEVTKPIAFPVPASDR